MCCEFGMKNVIAIDLALLEYNMGQGSQKKSLSWIGIFFHLIGIWHLIRSGVYTVDSSRVSTVNF